MANASKIPLRPKVITHLFTRVFLLLPSFILLLLLTTSLKAADQAEFNPASERVKRKAESDVSAVIQDISQRFCHDACKVLNIEATVNSNSKFNGDLGFDDVENASITDYQVQQVVVKMMVDNRIGQSSKNRILALAEKYLSVLPYRVVIETEMVEYPEPISSMNVAKEMQESVKNKVTKIIQELFDSYCPTTCFLIKTNIKAKRVPPEESLRAEDDSIIMDKDGTSIKIEEATVSIGLDKSISPDETKKILELLKLKTSFLSGITFNVSNTEFPKTEAQLLEMARLEKEKLAKMEEEKRLKLEQEAREAEEKKKAASERKPASVGENKDENDPNKKLAPNSPVTPPANAGLPAPQTAPPAPPELPKEIKENIEVLKNAFLAILVCLGIIFLLVTIGLVLGGSGRREKEREARNEYQPQPNYNQGDNPNRPSAPVSAVEAALNSNKSKKRGEDPVNISLNMENASMRDDLLNTLSANPKVSKEVFGRMLLEDGVEKIAKYLHLLGETILYEVQKDPTLQREIHELSEFFHKTTQKINDEESNLLYKELEQKVTASKVKVMTKKAFEKFDFINNMDPKQIFNLVETENSQVQGIVLTQLKPNKRTQIFEMFSAEKRTSLLKELCNSDHLPKEYLYNVASALEQKMRSRPEFDTTNIGGTVILMDLLEKSTLEDQKQLLDELYSSNIDVAQSLKSKLVTVYTMPFLPDNLLLEIVLNLGHEELTAFLKGSSVPLREKILQRAPENLSEALAEEIGENPVYNREAHALAVSMVANRIRNFSNLGLIDLLEINDKLFKSLDENPNKDEAENQESNPENTPLAS